ncbi:MAG: pentapeptide repeat-containing protein [Methylacidiphilales bacterium]|nr:pentapeptide repeat-containing protein [Candidatus Methylacidiphilales bacterium]
MNHRIDFCNQNLHNRSFPGLELNHANFSGADVRGCNFCHAQLQGANFLGAKFGQPPRVFISLRISALVVLFATFTAISHMTFGVLGNTPEIPAWSYTKALIVSLVISGLGASLRRIFHQQSILEKLITTLSGTTSAALLGFYYGGTIQNNNLQIAAISALITSIIAAVLCFLFFEWF